METYPPQKGELLSQKWERFLAAERPTHYFVVVPKGTTMRGPHVEFGFLLREYGVRQLLDRVRFFIETGTDEAAVLAGYETELIGLVGLDWWGDADQLARRMARRIDNILYSIYAPSLSAPTWTHLTRNQFAPGANGGIAATETNRFIKNRQGEVV